MSNTIYEEDVVMTLSNELQSAIGTFSTQLAADSLIKAASCLNIDMSFQRELNLLILKILSNYSADAISALGDMYYRGIGVNRDADKGVSLFLTAAQAGSSQAQYDLGWYYYEKNDWIRAIECFEVCTQYKDSFSEEKLSQIYACLGDSYMKLSVPQMQPGVEWLTLAADKYQNGFACRRLGQIYSDHALQLFSPEKAICYYKSAVQYKDLVAVRFLGRSYLYGNEELSLQKDLSRALETLRPFENSDDTEIQRLIGHIFLEDDESAGISKDLAKAKKYFLKAVDKEKSPNAAADLGYVCFCLDQYEIAEKLLTFADESGVCKYSDFLGRMHKDGKLGAKNISLAIKYYDRAYQKDTLNNFFTCAEYVEILEEDGQFAKAYEVAEYGFKKYNDIYFVYYKAKLVLYGKVRDKISEKEASEMMELCIQYNTHAKEAHACLGQYYHSTHEYRNAENHFIAAYNEGDADSAVYLGRLYEYGGGSIIANVNKAYEWYVKATDAGSSIGAEEVACFKKSLLGGYKRVRRIY